MKRFLIVSVLVIAVGALLLELIRNDTGYVLISLGTTTIEMSFWVGVALLLGALLAIWLVIAIAKGLYRMATGGMGLAAKRSRRVEERTASGLIHFVESNWRAAKKDLLKASRHAQNPLVHYLAAARCSYELGEREETRKLLQRAERIAPSNELAVVLSQARIHLLDKKYEQCLATLKRARELAPNHPTVLDLLREVYWQLRDWRSLEELLPELRKQKIYKDDEQVLLEQNVYMALLAETSKLAELQVEGGSAVSAHGRGAVTKETATTGEQALADVWQRVPKTIKAQQPVVQLYCKLLVDVGATETAEKQIRQGLNDHWDSQLVRLYGLIGDGVAARKQLTTAEKWLGQRPNDPELLLALGRICLRNQLWGQARDYLQSSLAIDAKPETYAELARLLEYLGEHEKSTAMYQKGLLSSTHGLPALPMPDKNTLTKPGSEDDPHHRYVDADNLDAEGEKWSAGSGG